jgi:hypothetical protein
MYQSLITEPVEPQTIGPGSDATSTSLSLKSTAERGRLLLSGYERLHEQFKPVTVADAVAETVVPPEVPRATATFVYVSLTLKTLVSVWLWPG